MKTIFITLIILSWSLVLIAQDFAPIGAEWYYTEQFAFSGDINYLKIESVKDTVVNNKSCHKLLRHNYLLCTNRWGEEFVYFEDSVAYFYDADFDEFQVLFDLKAKKDSTWFIRIKHNDNHVDSLIVSVDSTDYVMINSKTLKRLYVTYTSTYTGNGDFLHQYTSQIIEKLGDVNYLFNIYPYEALACDENYSGGLRCYNDGDFGLYETGIAESCDYTHIRTNISQNENNRTLEIYPNPTTFQVQLNLNNNQEHSYILRDSQGRELQSEKFISVIQIDLSGFSKGNYIITIKQSGQVIYTRKIVKY